MRSLFFLFLYSSGRGKVVIKLKSGNNGANNCFGGEYENPDDR
jgi:hypothetical protein